ncbi:MAG TPA: quinoprotein dehydrogenase-associated SoxYZ-like carrier [Steroidobacteraceae bacterium]
MGLRTFLLMIALAILASPQARAVEEEQEQAARWASIQQSVFGARKVEDGSAWLSLEAPLRALDAALVPISIESKKTAGLKGLYLIIDENPAPLAGHFSFGPEADPSLLKLRVRVDAYTYIHAVAETTDGHLYAVERFVKAAGGCSAPAGADEQQALADLGHIKLRVTDGFSPHTALKAQLMIRHPNFNGMQMNQVTRLYTPARFIKSIDVSFDDTAVLHVDSDISMSTDPVLDFGFVPPHKGVLKVVVRDTSEATFTQSIGVPAAG